MEIASVGSVSTALSMAKTGDAVGTLMLKKTMELQEQAAQQLLQAVQPPPAAPSNPDNLGNNVDVKV